MYHLNLACAIATWACFFLTLCVWTIYGSCACRFSYRSLNFVRDLVCESIRILFVDGIVFRRFYEHCISLSFVRSFVCFILQALCSVRDWTGALVSVPLVQASRHKLILYSLKSRCLLSNRGCPLKLSCPRLPLPCLRRYGGFLCLSGSLSMFKSVVVF